MNKIGMKSYISGIAVILALMMLCYVLTFVIPGGEFARTIDDAGNEVLDTEAGFEYVDGGLPFWKWILSPFLVVGSDGGSTLIAVVIFLLVIGGVFEVLNRCELIRYMLDRTADKYARRKYLLLAVLIMIFMLLGAFVGSFEEVVPLVPIVVGLSIAFGWDVYVGIAASLIAVGCGFASGVMNPFTVGVAQKLAGLPVFSGIWLRIVGFVLIYLLLTGFVMVYASRHEKAPQSVKPVFEKNARLDRAILCFVLIIGAGVAAVIASAFISALRDYTMIIVAVMFLAAGISAAATAGIRPRVFFSGFAGGVVSILPAVLMILMASSIKYTLTEAKILDTIMYGAVKVAERIPGSLVILFIYLIVLVMNFFIASGSAKAFLLIPLLVPIARVFGVSPQLCVLAFAFGDGFSNVFYPTNPALLISLGLTNVQYPGYVRFAWKFQLANLVLTCGILLLGLAVGY